jgi:ribosomal protein S18 acetylase RimI-like enzyme
MSTSDMPAARLAGAHELNRVVQILVGAFHDDPVWSWAFPDPAHRGLQHARFWRVMVEGAARYPSVWVNADASAAAVWIPPGGTELSPAQERQLEPLLDDLLGRECARRVIGTIGAFERAHPHTVEHFYLSLLGTDPAHRGKGRGLALLSETLASVDAQEMPAYLEASNPANVRLYERYGFRRHSTFTLPDGGPDVITMWRQPATRPVTASDRGASRIR